MSTNKQTSEETKPNRISPLGEINSWWWWWWWRGYMWNKIISKLFQPSSTSVRNDYISACENLPEIISEAYCSSRIFSNKFNVAEI